MNRLPRFLALVMVTSLLIGFMIVPANAAEIDNDTWLNILDYSTANDSGSNMFVAEAGGDERTWALPRYMDIYSVDIVYTNVPVAYGYVSKITAFIGGRYYILTIEELGNNVFRAYASFSGSGSTNIKLLFDTPNAPQYIEILQFNVCSAATERFETTCYGTITYNGGSMEIVKDPSVTTPAYTDVYYTGNYEDCQYSVVLLLKDWRKYDFIDVQFSAICWNITSVSASFGGVNLDLATSDIVATNVIANQYMVNMRVDLRGLDRTDTGHVSIELNGNLVNDGGDNFFMIHSATGFVLLQDINPLYYYFDGVEKTLNSGFDRLIDALSPEADTSLGDTVVSQGQQIQNYEQNHQNTLQTSVNLFQSSSNIGKFATSLAFIGNYTTRVFNALGDFQIVYTLPLTIGLILFLASRVRGNDKPHKNNERPKRGKDPGTTSGNDTTTYSSYY